MANAAAQTAAVYHRDELNVLLGVWSDMDR
jgi:hypothetical protein